MYTRKKTRLPIFVRKITSLLLGEVTKGSLIIRCNSFNSIPTMNIIVAKAITIFNSNILWLVRS